MAFPERLSIANKWDALADVLGPMIVKAHVPSGVPAHGRDRVQYGRGRGAPGLEWSPLFDSKREGEIEVDEQNTGSRDALYTVEIRNLNQMSSLVLSLLAHSFHTFYI